MTLLLALAAGIYAITVLYYWLPLLAVRYRGVPLPLSPEEGRPLPMLIAVAPCRGAMTGAIPGMVEMLKAQEYPPDRYRIVLVIDSEGPEDRSAETARAAGAEVLERIDPVVRTKGGAINELLQQLRGEPWDALLILDIDARGTPSFLMRVAAYLQAGAQAIQAAPVTRNADESLFTRIGAASQALSGLIQRGRSALGLSAILSGTGMIFSREALQQLAWQTSTGQRLSDDGELNYRCALRGIPVIYAPDLALHNDVPADAETVVRQRRNWFVSYIEALRYIGPVLWRFTAGDWRAMESVFFMEFLPACSLSFALAGVGIFGLGILSVFDARCLRWLEIFTVLWGLHAVYYVLALRTVQRMFTWREIAMLPVFLTLRGWALFEGLLLGSRTDPGRHTAPTPHRD